jgi:hypothetical protein
LPRVVEKFGALEDQARKVVTDVRSVANEIKDDPSVLLKGRPKETKDASRSNSAARSAGPRATPGG